MMPDEKKVPEPERAPQHGRPLPPPVVEEELDEATASLSTALRFSFFLLKLVMVALVAVFAASGFYHVGKDEVALELRFGKIMGVGEDRIKKSGEWRFAWPAPIGEVVRVSTAPRDMSVNTFWTRISEVERESALQDAEPIERIFEDAQDAFFMTGDMVRVAEMEDGEVERQERVPAPNLLQGRFEVQYTVRAGNAERYFMNVMDEAEEDRERRLVRAALEGSIIEVAAGLGVYDILLDRVSIGQMVRDRVQSALDAVDSGITVTSVSMNDKKAPADVAAAFDRVSSADQEFRSQIAAAEGYRNDILSKAAGGQGSRIHEALQDLWKVETVLVLKQVEETEELAEDRPWVEREDERAQGQIEQLRKRVDDLFVDSETGELLVQGEAARIIRNAESDRERIVAQAAGAAEVVSALLDQYEAEEDGESKLLNYLQHRRIETLSTLVENAKEKFYLSGKTSDKREVRLRLSRDPEALKARSRVGDAQ